MIDCIRAGRFEIPVLYLDNHLLVAVKPANLPAQADSSGDDDLLSILKRYIGEHFNKPGNVYLGLVHRLDRPVGGVMVFARTSKAAARLSETFARHAQDRRYLAVLQGELTGARTLEDDLLKDGRIGVIGHKCYAEKDADGVKQSVYLNVAFLFDPETHQATEPQVIATRRSYPDAAAKLPKLKDCAFTSGIVLREDGKADLYSGLGDTHEGRVTIDNPFGDLL